MLFSICISWDSRNRCRMGRFGCFQSDCRSIWSKSGNFVSHAEIGGNGPLPSPRCSPSPSQRWKPSTRARSWILFDEISQSFSFHGYWSFTHKFNARICEFGQGATPRIKWISFLCCVTYISHFSTISISIFVRSSIEGFETSRQYSGGMRLACEIFMLQNMNVNCK